jgi:small subunit ribosomal protein S7
MAKKFTASNETLKPDPMYNSRLVAKFINCMMWAGKKSVAQKVFYDAMKIIEEKNKDAKPLEVFEKAIANVKPMIEVRSKRVGGASYQVPMQVGPKRQQSRAATVPDWNTGSWQFFYLEFGTDF